MPEHCHARPHPGARSTHLGLLLALALVSTLGGCEGEVVGADHWNDRCDPPQLTSEFFKPEPYEVDLLFVIDNSGSMAPEQSLLLEQFGTLMQALRGLGFRLPDMHIGVVTTDLGIAPWEESGCELPDGDGGRLHRRGGVCDDLLRHPFIVDVEPQGCVATRDADGQRCVAHDCGPVHCAHAPTTTLSTDDHGCPRCVNYLDAPLDLAFTCLGLVGSRGCGLEQPLEAMRRALQDNPYNEGFLRPSSFLAVVFITDEDDCSARDATTLFDFTDSSPEGPLGPSTTRCFEFGVTCEPADATRLALGLRTDCRPAEDPAGLLQPVSRYAELLRSLRPPHRRAVAALAGPVGDRSVEIVLSSSGDPTLAPSCRLGTGGDQDGAFPAIRLHGFIEALQDPGDLPWAYTSSCSPDYGAALEGIGSFIRAALDVRCPFHTLEGCADPGAALGTPGDTEACNDPCAASCWVAERPDAARPDEEAVPVPPCLEICPAGDCPGNLDPARAYRQGHPALRDQALPVAACWHVGFNPACASSAGAEIRVSRRTEPATTPLLEVTCAVAPATERCCGDGVDNDGDCLVDGADPDCAPLETTP